jgi:hypothetical protein
MDTKEITTINEAMTLLRKLFPKMRRTASTAITHSGGRQTIFGCLCGARHTTSTDWNGRNARHVGEWQGEHAKCCITLANKYLKEKKVEVYFG